MKAVVAAFNQEKALVGAFSVITNLRMELFQSLQDTEQFPLEEMAGLAHDLNDDAGSEDYFMGELRLQEADTVTQ